MYEDLFSGSEFGSRDSYVHSIQGLQELNEVMAVETAPVGPDERVVVGPAFELVNMEALHEHVVSKSDRRKEQLDNYIALLKQHGTRVDVAGLDMTPNDESKFMVYERRYFKWCGVGGMWASGGPSAQNITREAREACHADLCIAEFDITAAAAQVMCLEMARFNIDSDDVKHAMEFIRLFVSYSSLWKERVSTYYNVSSAGADIFKRLHNGGSPFPDVDDGSPRPHDTLPCVQELRWSMRAAREFLIKADAVVFAPIQNLARVVVKPDPVMSAWAIYLQELLSKYQMLIREVAEPLGIVTVAYVVDSIYALGRDMDDLMNVFTNVQASVLTTHGLRIALKDSKGTKLVDAVEEVFVQHVQGHMSQNSDASAGSCGGSQVGAGAAGVPTFDPYAVVGNASPGPVSRQPVFNATPDATPAHMRSLVPPTQPAHMGTPVPDDDDDDDDEDDAADPSPKRARVAAFAPLSPTQPVRTPLDEMKVQYTFDGSRDAFSAATVRAG